ncbi:hypothetical protein DB42_BR00090 [Neochlamydia sp. EPS4]|nr:hypothetical protein DB42_BR00090 [Neochlamydia sp. EPS4]
MEKQIIMIYCLFDEYTQPLNYHDWPNTRWSSSEVMLILIPRRRFFYENVSKANSFVLGYVYIKKFFNSNILDHRIYRIFSRRKSFLNLSKVGKKLMDCLLDIW